MAVQVLTPSSREEWLAIRNGTAGSSEIPALLGIDPRLTAFELFARKTGQYRRAVDRTRVLEKSIHLPPLERGNFMEEKGLELMRMLRPTWEVTPNTIPGGRIFQDLEAGVSSTPDAFLVAPDRPGRGALQIKNVAQMIFERDGWIDATTGDLGLPSFVAVQAIVDAWLSGCQWACAGVVVINFGVDFYLEDVPLHGGILERVLSAAADFKRRVRENVPCPPDYARDMEVIKNIYADDDGGTIDLSGDDRALKLVAGREGLKRIEIAGAEAAKERKVLDATLIHLLGNAARGTLSDGRVVEAKTIRRSGYMVEPTTFRAVKIK